MLPPGEYRRAKAINVLLPGNRRRTKAKGILLLKKRRTKRISQRKYYY